MPKVRRPFSIMNEDTFYYVRMKISVWPTIYGDERPILFPTEKAAMRFAQNNLSSVAPVARVYSPSGELLSTLQFA